MDETGDIINEMIELLSNFIATDADPEVVIPFCIQLACTTCITYSLQKVQTAVTSLENKRRLAQNLASKG